MSTQPTVISGSEHTFAQRRGHFKALLGLLLAAALIAAAGCGGDEGEPGGGGASTPESTTSAEDAKVIEGWVRALSAGDVEGAADFFALPSGVENGSLVAQLETREDAIAFNQSLPCGGEVIEVQSIGEFTTATFRLTERPGGDCGTGTGGAAATSFLIEDGKITEWRRVGTDSGRYDRVEPNTT